MTQRFARSSVCLAIMTTILSAPVAAQRVNDARAGIGPVAPTAETHPRFHTSSSISSDSTSVIRTPQTRPDLIADRPTASGDGRVSKRSLAIGAAVGAATGGAAGFILYRGSDFSKNEAWPLFAGSAVLGGALLGAGVGMAVVAFLLGN